MHDDNEAILQIAEQYAQDQMQEVDEDLIKKIRTVLFAIEAAGFAIVPKINLYGK